MTSSGDRARGVDADSGPASARAARGPRRAKRLAGALAVTLLGAVLPGAGLLWARRWLLGGLVLVSTLALAGLALRSVDGLDALVDLVFDPARLRGVAALLAAAFLAWAAVVFATYALVRPRPMARWQGVLGGALVTVLCLSVAAPVALATRYARVQADLVDTVFEDNVTATAPRDVTEKDPWGGRRRVSVLLLGGDDGVGRSGVRTDTVILLTADTLTGDTVMFSLPRNMMNAQFPPDSPLHDLYPDGFRGYGDPAAWMLNAIYGQVPALHPGILGKSRNEGADAVKQAVAGSLGITVDYYVLVNLEGFRQIVDAMGGVTVNINEPIPIHGDADRGIPPVDYLQPGPDQRLNGFQALWYSRGRYGLDDYNRMLRQRCMVGALVEEAKPLNLLRRYQALASAGKQIVRTDVPADLLPAFVDLAWKMKDADVRSVAFVSSDRFFPGDPDFEWLHGAAQRALSPPPPPRRPQDPGGRVPEETPPSPPTAAPGSPEDPGAAVRVTDSCGYHPVSGAGS